MKYLFAAAVLVAFGFAPARAADCDLLAKTSGSGLQKLYDPFSPQNTVVDLQIVVRNDGTATCQTRFYVAPTSGHLALDAGGQEILYRIEGGNNGSHPGEHGPFLVSVPAGSSEMLSVQFTILAQQVVPVAFYTSTLAVRGESAANAPILVGGANPVITLAVPSRSEMSISGASSPPLAEQGLAPASINFPRATTGQSGRVFVNVWANSSVQIVLTSENGGELKHLDDPNLPPISYTATFDGAVVGLGGSYVVGRAPPMSTAGASYELLVTLGDTSRNFAGNYRDRIIVDVNSN